MNDIGKPWFGAVLVYEGALNSEARRVTSLQVLGILALGTGLLIAMTAPSVGTSLLLFSTLLWWPWLAGLLLASSGLVLIVGTFTPRPRIAWVGAVLGAVWYAWFGIGFVVQWVQWVSDHASDPHILEPPIYPVAVYLGLSALHTLNARGIRERMGPKKR